MTEVEKLLKRLEEMNVKVRPFINRENNPSPEDVAREMNKALDNLEQGLLEEWNEEEFLDNTEGLLY